MQPLDPFHHDAHHVPHSSAPVCLLVNWERFFVKHWSIFCRDAKTRWAYSTIAPSTTQVDALPDLSWYIQVKAGKKQKVYSVVVENSDHAIHLITPYTNCMQHDRLKTENTLNCLRQHETKNGVCKRPTSAIIVVHSTCHVCLEVTCQQVMWAEFLHQRTAIIRLCKDTRKSLIVASHNHTNIKLNKHKQLNYEYNAWFKNVLHFYKQCFLLLLIN